MDERQVAWAAGFFEGEGSIYFRPSTASVGVRLNNTDLDVLTHFADVVGVGSIRGPYTKGRPAHYKPIYAWETGRFEDCEYVMGLLLPWLGARRRERWREVVALREAAPVKRRRRSTE